MKRKGSITLNQKEQQRLRVISGIEAGAWTAEEAARMLGCSDRQVRRLRANYRDEGAAAFMHGNRGRPSPHRISDELRQQVRELGSGAYKDCNDSHLTELLILREGIVLSRKSVQRIRREGGQKAKRGHRPPRHRSRRERMPQEGMLLQVDGSKHRWFGPQLPECTLVGAIDDATGKVVALFREQEDAQGYFLLLRQVLLSQGVPLDIYRDRHGIFQPNPKAPVSIDAQLQGHLEAEPTQFGRALEELGIGSIAAHSPEAKGRIERLWGTLQDRLVVELALAGVQDIKAANRFLPAFIKRHNARFAVSAEEPGPAYRPLDPGLDLDRILSFRYQRSVARDNTVRLESRVVQIPPGPRRRSYFAARVWVHELLDGSLGVWYQDQWLVRGRNGKADALVRARSRRPALPERPAAVALPLPLETATSEVAAVRSGRPPRPAADHPWRMPLRAHLAGRTESLSSSMPHSGQNH